MWAADLDLVVSYDTPYWPASSTFRDKSNLGPLRNTAGMWLTATSYGRSLINVPSPTELVPPLPTSAEEPNRFLGTGPSKDAPGEIYWLVESITSKRLVRGWL
jgi:hypothetical protein